MHLPTNPDFLNEGESTSLEEVRDIAYDPLLDVLYASAGNRVVRINTETGEVFPVAGQKEIGFHNGPGPEASFKFPHGLDVDEFGNIYVCDQGNNVIRKINVKVEVE